MKKSIYSKVHVSIIKALIDARKNAGFSQKQAAVLLKTSQSYISKIESGQRKIDIVRLNDFAKIYNKKLDNFIKPSNGH